MAIAPNTTFVSGAVLTAAQMNALPFGIVAYGTLAGNAGLTTTTGDLGVSVTFTAIANRYYKYTFFSNAANASAAGTMETYITDSSNNIKTSMNLYVIGGAFYSFQQISFITTETAGSITRKLRGKVQTGTGTIFGPLQLWVEDIGPA